MKRILMLAAIAVVAPWSVIQAQQQEPKLKRSVSPRTPEVRKHLLLEIDYIPELSPAYSNVGAPDERPKWIWFGRFQRIPGREPEPGRLPILAVKLESQFNGETADVRLTLYRGVKGFEKEDLVGVYQVGLNEEKTLSELAEFGIEPFIIKLIEPLPPNPLPPGVNNLTTSIQVVKVESHNLPRPAYRITFQNLSSKSLSALSVSLTTNGQQGVSTMFQGEEGRTLIEPSGVSEQYLMVTMRERLETATPSSNIINIRSAVFRDFSFEGDFQSACKFETFVMARRQWLRRVIALLDETTMVGSDHIAAAKHFKERVLALNFEFTESEKNRRSVNSPRCPNPAEAAFIGTKALSLQLLRDLDRIIETRPAPPVNFQSWLVERRDRYHAWLSRL